MPIDSVSTAGGKLFATYLKDVATKAYVYALDGTPENEVTLPAVLRSLVRHDVCPRLVRGDPVIDRRHRLTADRVEFGFGEELHEAGGGTVIT